MFSTFVRSITTVAIAGLLATAAPASASTIFFDGFETPVIGSGPFALSHGFEYRNTGDPGWGWTSGGGNVVQFNNTYVPGNVQGAGDGEQSIQLEIRGVFIERSIATVAGVSYLLNFLLGAYVDGAPDNSVLGVGIDGNPLIPFAATPTWTPQSLAFVATGSSTTLRFESLAAAGQPFTYPHLDNVTLIAMPEPASLVLMGTGLIAAARLRARRRRG